MLLPRSIWRRLFGLGSGMGLMVLLLAGQVEAGAHTALTRTNDAFCIAAQYLLADTTQNAQIEIHSDFESFKKSKTSIAPLTIHQYVQYAADDSRRPLRISCKLATVDHLQSAFGAAAAGPQHSCQDLNHLMVDQVFAALTTEEHARVKLPPESFSFEPDLNTVLGSKWVADYQYIWQDADGSVHLLAKALHVPYQHWLWRFAPERFRGVYYCHLVAPEYLRAIMLGAVVAP